MTKRDHSTPIPEDLLTLKGLPFNPDAERFILGAILAQQEKALDLFDTLTVDDFHILPHQRIFNRIKALMDRSEELDRIVLAEELGKHGELESVGGLTFLLSLDEGLPEISNIAGYFKIVKDKAALRRAIFTFQSGIDRAVVGTDSPEEIASSVTQSLEEIQTGSKEYAGSTPEQIVSAFGIGAFLDPSLRPGGLKTGFRRFDEATTGLRAGELTILAARPSVGKTQCALNIGAHIAEHGKPVAFFNLEMSGVSLISRLVCAEGRIDQHKYRQGYLNPNERRNLQLALDRVCGWPILIFDTPGIGIPALTKHVRKLVKDGVALVVLDYLQLMDIGRAENRNVGVGKVSGALKKLTLEHHIPILALSQLSRADKTARALPPTLEMLRDSGSLEQDADNVVFIWREEMVKQGREDNRGKAELRIAKQRNGPLANCEMRFVAHYGRFENCTEDMPDGGDLGPEPPPSEF